MKNGTLPAWAAALWLATAGPLAADIAIRPGVITANPHRIGSCSQTTPPQNTLAAAPELDANAYHTIGCGAGSPNPTCIVNAVLGPGFLTHNKPRLIASDGGKWTNAQAIGWVNGVKALNQSVGRAVAHYEHYERHFGEGCELTACEQPGNPCVPGCPNGPPCNRSCPMSKVTPYYIDSEADFPDCDRSDQLRQALGNAATPLAANGTLLRVGDGLYWKVGTSPRTPTTLMGYSWMGALTGLQFNVLRYLDALAGLGTNGVNLTRVWAVEQWTALAVDRCGDQPVAQSGVTPFAVAPTSPPKYNLFGADAGFYSRLRKYAQGGADRGIVVQLTLFDKHGLVATDDPAPECQVRDEGRWDDSPYRRKNNVNGFLDNSPAPSACFLRWTGDIGSVHQQFIQRVAAEAGTTGNVMFEIFNEAMNGDFTATAECPLAPDTVVQFQIEAARRLRAALPRSVARDAFNEDPDQLALDGKVADTGEAWKAVNARISTQYDEGARRMLGVLTAADDGSGAMEALLPVDVSGQEAASVRATLNLAQGHLGLGLRNAGESLLVELRQLGDQSLALELKNGAPSELRTLAVHPLGAGAAPLDVRLRVDLARATASVYVDADAPAALFEVPLGTSTRFDEAFVRGWSDGETPFLSSHASVDDFEAATFCSSAACTP